jgi:pyridoxine 5-phosphate synthase
MLPRLGVNVDHVATLRQARRTTYPDPVVAAAAAELGGADQITVHLREDRRHILDRDVEILRQTVQSRLNLEMAATEEMIAIAVRVAPDVCTLVPERRQELTTEGGLEVAGQHAAISRAVRALREGGRRVSLFVDPDLDQVRASRDAGADTIELHTGTYCDAPDEERPVELERLAAAAREGARLGLEIAAGHGLHYHNVLPVAAIPEIAEFNIGHAIVARAVMTGMERAVREMKELLDKGRRG